MKQSRERKAAEFKRTAFTPVLLSPVAPSRSRGLWALVGLFCWPEGFHGGGQISGLCFVHPELEKR